MGLPLHSVYHAWYREGDPKMPVDLLKFLLCSPYFGDNLITPFSKKWAFYSKEFISWLHCSATVENNGLFLLYIISGQMRGMEGTCTNFKKVSSPRHKECVNLTLLSFLGSVINLWPNKFRMEISSLYWKNTIQLCNYLGHLGT